MNQTINIKFIFLIALSLLFLASNSIFCKLALVNNYIDAYSFTLLRLLFGAITLVLIYFYKTKKIYFSKKINWLSSFMLFSYAICFSYSFINIDAGMGTLLLFTVVQIVMVLFSLFQKEKITVQKFFGVILALFGLAYLLYPKDDFTISYFHAFLMFLSAIGWAIFSVLAKKSNNATLNATDSFVKAFIFTIFFAIFYLFFFENSLKIDLYTSILAIISGSITTAFGVFIWYSILPKIEIMTASIIQLIVPIIAIILSIVFLNETFTFELFISTIIILFGIFIALYKKRKI